MNENSFSYQRLRTWPRFEMEAEVNFEMAYWLFAAGCARVARLSSAESRDYFSQSIAHLFTWGTESAIW